MTLVSGSTAASLATAGTYSVDGVTADPPRIVTGSGGYTVRAGGTAEGQLNSLNTIIPNYRKALDDTRGQPGDQPERRARGRLRPDRRGGHAAARLVERSDHRRLAHGADHRPEADRRLRASAPTAGVAALDHGNADAIAQLRQSTTGTDASYRKMIVELGVQAAVAGRNVDIQSVISTQVDAARESVAGVNIDEEMTNMLSFQHAYSAAGRLVTAIDETLDKLINRTGRVGL